jgi:glycopeptide antibiotics resistance protein
MAREICGQSWYNCSHPTGLTPDFPNGWRVLLPIEFFPYPLICGLLLLTLVLLRQRRRGWLRLVGLTLFGLYLLALANLVIFPVYLPQPWPAYASWQDLWFTLRQDSNLVPFYYGHMLADVSAGRLAAVFLLREIVGNFLLTLPFGLGISLLVPMRPRQVMWLALGVGLGLEGAQLLILVLIGPALHAVDINDVLLNALGVLAGYALFRLTAGLRDWTRRFSQKFSDRR